MNEQGAPVHPTARVAFSRSLMALILGLIVSALVAYWHHRSLAEQGRGQMQRLAERSAHGLANHLDQAGLLIRAVQAVFLSSDDVSDQEFIRLYQGLDVDGGFPALLALAYSARERDHDGQLRYVTRMIAPVPGNERVLGLDVASQPPNMLALEDSIASNRPVLSGAFRLLQQEGTDRRGVTIRLPIFSSGDLPVSAIEAELRTVGSLAASFDLGSLLARAFGDEAMEHFGIQVVDITDGLNDVLFEHQSGLAVLSPGMLSFKDRVEFGSRVWQLRFDTLPSALGLPVWPLLTLLIGLIASAMLALAVWSLLGARSRIETQARRVAAQYETSETRFRALNELLPAIVIVARGEDGNVEYINQAGRRRFRIRPGDTEPNELAALLANPELDELARRVAQDGEPVFDRIVRIGADPSFWANLSLSRIELDGEAKLLAVASDVTELRELTERLRHQATHDELTGLYNRRGFEQALTRALAAVDAGRGPSALLYIDLDQFKVVNESCGHAAGDELLQRLTGQLQTLLQPDDALARLGGDEFGVVLADGREPIARAMAEQMRQAIADFVYRRDGRRYPVSASLGLVFLDRPGIDPQQLMATADTLCFLAKEHGRNRVRVSSEVDPETLLRRAQTHWIGQVREAMADGRLRLHYQHLQPLREVAADSGAHIELLLRMHDESGTAVATSDFVPAAERFGLMPQIDRWVVDQALSRLDQLRIDGRTISTCSINLSAATVVDEHFGDYLIDAIARHQVAAQRLCFEVTETAAVGDLQQLRSFMRRLRLAGCRFALDDFGTGMASFGYLRQLPVDLIKIDGSFIRRIEHDALSLSIVRAIVEIGHQAGLQVVAEGVETDAALQRLCELGVDFAQGFLLHRPEPLPKRGAS